MRAMHHTYTQRPPTHPRDAPWAALQVAAHGGLDLLELVQELGGRGGGVDGADGVEEAGLVRNERGLGLVEQRSGPHNVARGAESAEGSAEVVGPAADVAPEGKQGERHGKAELQTNFSRL